MNWKKRYEEFKITNINQISVGDLIRYCYDSKKTSGYTVISRIEGNEMHGHFTENKEEALEREGQESGYIEIGNKLFITHKIMR